MKWKMIWAKIFPQRKLMYILMKFVKTYKKDVRCLYLQLGMMS